MSGNSNVTIGDPLTPDQARGILGLPNLGVQPMVSGPQPVTGELAVTTEPSRPWDARALGAMSAIAGRCWGLKPEAMELLAAAMRGGITFASFDDMPEEDGRQDGEKSGTAVIGLYGMVTPFGSLLSMLFGGGGGGLNQFQRELQGAVADESVSNIVLDIDSPGGLVDLVPETAAMVRKAREVKPVTAVASTEAASAAYWIAAQANELVVTPSGSVGSIGVYTMHTDRSEQAEMAGIDVTLIYAGKYKVEGNQYEPLTDAAKAARQERVDTIYDMFVEDVAAGREDSVEAVREGYGEGRVELAEEAVKVGLADRVGTLSEVLEGLSGGSGGDDGGEAPAEAAAGKRMPVDLL